MTTTNNRLAKRMNLVGQAKETFSNSLGYEDSDKRDGIQFEKDFPRTSELELILNKEPRVYYKASEVTESNSGEEVASKQSQFTALLREQRPELEGIIKQELNQAGAFYTGRIALETIFFPKVGIQGSERKHRLIVEVINPDEVTVTEMVSYKSLKLLPLSSMHASLSEEEKTSLEGYRNSRNVQTKLEAEQDDGTRALSFNDGQPLSLTIQYTLRYCKETGIYKLNVPSKEDITLTVPTSLAKGLILGSKWTINDKISEFISRLVEIIKKLVLVKIGEHLVTEQDKQDQAKPSEVPQPSSFSQRMRL